jgi:hypothetical protein
MTTIVDMVAEKAGVSEQQAQIAVNTIMTFLKDKLPEPIASQLDGLMETDVSGYSEQIDSVLGNLGGIEGLGGLFGGKKSF